jgi:hypothetical protein
MEVFLMVKGTVAQLPRAAAGLGQYGRVYVFAGDEVRFHARAE